MKNQTVLYVYKQNKIRLNQTENILSFGILSCYFGRILNLSFKISPLSWERKPTWLAIWRVCWREQQSMKLNTKTNKN